MPATRAFDISAPGKLIALLVALTGCFVYIIVVTVVESATGDTAPAWAAITLMVGYIIGNGVGAARGVQTVGPFRPHYDPESHPYRRADDREPPEVPEP